MLVLMIMVFFFAFVWFMAVMVLLRRMKRKNDLKANMLADEAKLIDAELLTAEERKKLQQKFKEKLDKQLAAQPAASDNGSFAVAPENAPGGFPVILKKETNHG